MPGTRARRALGPFALALLFVLGIASSQAGSACKGLGVDSCQKNSSCTWVEPQARKDGVKASGYCKSKPTGAAQSGNGGN